MWWWGKLCLLNVFSLNRKCVGRPHPALFFVTLTATTACFWLANASIPFLLLHLWTESLVLKSQSWLRWAAGGCFSPAMGAYPAPRRCLHPGARQMSQTWALAFNLSVCPAGTDHGAARRRTRIPLLPRFRPAQPPVSTEPFVCLDLIRIHSRTYRLVFCGCELPVWLVLVVALLQNESVPMTQFFLYMTEITKPLRLFLNVIPSLTLKFVMAG